MPHPQHEQGTFRHSNITIALLTVSETQFANVAIQNLSEI